MTKILLLAGGDSDERAVSLRSGAATAEALRSCGHEVTELDASQSAETLVTEAHKHDVVFLALHGKGGEDGTLQALFEIENIAFVGSGSVASALCFDKWRYYQHITSNGLPSPRTELVDAHGFEKSELARQPYVLKPNDGGSSIDTFIVRDVSEAPHDEIVAAFARHQQMILQALISGQELTVAVIGDRALPVIEIIPPSSGEFDYENKYNGASQELCPPLHIEESVQTQARDLAERAHAVCECRDLSRTDFMVDAAGVLYILETNTIPGLTPQSLLPKAAAADGQTMPQMVDNLVRMALSRRQ